MIREIACDIKDLILSSGYVNTHFEMCEFIKRGDVVYPAQYSGGGNYEDAFNNDVNGNSYLRKNGDVSYQPMKSAKKMFGCDDGQFVTVTYPLRLVMVVPKGKMIDDAFSDDTLATEIITLLNGSLTTTITGVKSLEYNVTGYDTDSLSIWKAEVQGRDYQMNFAYTYIAINFNATALVNQNCLQNPCYAY